MFPTELSIGWNSNHNPDSREKGAFFLYALLVVEGLHNEWRGHLRTSVLGAETFVETEQQQYF